MSPIALIAKQAAEKSANIGVLPAGVDAAKMAECMLITDHPSDDPGMSKTASNAARRLFTKLMKDTAKGKVRWHNTPHSTAKKVLDSEVLMPSRHGASAGDMTFTRHAPIRSTGNAILGLDRAHPAYVQRGYSSHTRHKQLGNWESNVISQADGPVNPIPLAPRSGALRYAGASGDPALDAAMRRHGANIVPKDLMNYLHASRINPSVLPRNSADTLRRYYPFSVGSEPRVIDRRATLTHLAKYKPGMGNVTAEFPTSPKPKLTFLEELLNYIKRLMTGEKQAAEKSANIGPLAKSVGAFGKAFLKPTVKAKPALVQAAKPLPTGPVANQAVKVLNSVANVPSGERFMQRPLGNSIRLLSLDGVPGMRRAGQAALAGTAAYGGAKAKHYYDYTNQTIDSSAKGIADMLGLSESSHDDVRKSLHGIKWDLAADQTLGSLGRFLRGTVNPRQAYHDKAVRDLVRDAVAYNVHYDESEPATSILGQVRNFVRNRNLPAVAANNASVLARYALAPPRSAVEASLGTTQQLQLAGLKGDETSVERILRNRFPQIRWDDMSQERKQQVIAAVASAAAAAGSAATR